MNHRPDAFLRVAGNNDVLAKGYISSQQERDQTPNKSGITYLIGG